MRLTLNILSSEGEPYSAREDVYEVAEAVNDDHALPI